MLILTGWVLIIPPVTPATQGFYLGADGRPANVAVEDPHFQWTVYGHYNSGAACERAKSELVSRSLRLDPAKAQAVAWSFAECFADNDRRLHPFNGPNELLR
jgi:hypothetical protein